MLKTYGTVLIVADLLSLFEVYINISIMKYTKWMYDIYQKLKLKYYRKMNGYTQKQVAESLDCSVSAYAKYETGEREPSISILVALADLYYISIDELVGHNILSRDTDLPEQDVFTYTNTVEPLPFELIDVSEEDKLAFLKREFDIERAKSLNNQILLKEVNRLQGYRDILLVKDIYAKIDFYLTVTGFNVKDMVRIFGVSRSGYYHWRKHGDLVMKRNERIADLILQYELPALNSAGYMAVRNYLRSLDEEEDLKNISVARVKRIMDAFEIISKNHMNSSMSKPHTPNDNACIESFFASLKCEYLYRYKLRNNEIAKKMIDRYIHFYNNIRIHTSCMDTPFSYWSVRLTAELPSHESSEG